MPKKLSAPTGRAPTARGANDLDALIAKLSTSPLYRKRAPHPNASELTLPDERPAPASLRTWAAFDNRYPWYFPSRRGDQPIADKAGIVRAKPMPSVLKSVCMEDIDEEIDEETKADLKERVTELADEFPGMGVRMAPDDHPDRILWFGEDEGDEATMLWYEDDAIEATKSFDEWVLGLFAGD